ncbi:MAG: ATP-binding cassette domain-containing protein, partial [Bdellovibrionota bacterium]
MRAIEISEATYYIGKKQILGPVSLSVEKGEFAVLLGENGAGKTTLVDLIMGFRQATSGRVFVNGDNSSTDPYRLREKLTYLSERVDLPGDWSIGDFLAFNRVFYPNYEIEFETELLSTFKVDSSARAGNLSAGQLRRAQIVAGLAARPAYALVDEITAVLDITGRLKFMEALAKLARNGTTIVMATNILEDLHRFASRIF